MAERVLVADQAGKATGKQAPPDPWRAATLLIGAGFALALVGWTDAALLWVPPSLGDAAWRFRTIGATFSALPLGTIGLSAVAIGLVGRGAGRSRRVVGALMLLIALLLAVGFVVYVVTVPAALGSVQEGTSTGPFKVLVARTSLFALAYIAIYSGVGWLTLRR